MMITSYTALVKALHDTVTQAIAPTAWPAQPTHLTKVGHSNESKLDKYATLLTCVTINNELENF